MDSMFIVYVIYTNRMLQVLNLQLGGNGLKIV